MIKSDLTELIKEELKLNEIIEVNLCPHRRLEGAEIK
jgi:hypothetical protein